MNPHYIPDLLPAGKYLKPFQIEAVEQMIVFLKERGSVYNAFDMRCVSGDTLIKVNRGGNCRTHTIKWVYENHLKWKTNIPTKTRSWYEAEYIGLNKIEGVIYQGIKETIEIKTETKSISLTPEHKILTKQGWVEAQYLLLNDLIATDRCRPHKKDIPTKRQHKFRSLYVPLDYPQGHLTRVRAKIVRRREKHVLAYEAYQNGFSNVIDYVMALFKGLKPSYIVDSKQYDIHHKNENHFDNSCANLQRLTRVQHSRHHAKLDKYLNFNQGIKWEKVTATTKKGEEEVYDLVMANPHRNFAANGIIVHNCGKSCMSIATANYFQFQKILIISPASVVHVWKKEIETFSTLNLKSFPIYIVESGKDLTDERIAGAGIVILSYSLAATENAVKVLTAKQAKPFQLLICDESHYCVNRKAKRTKAVLNDIWPTIPYRICLSGTPFLSSITNAYPVFNAIAPELFPNYWKFAQRYANELRTPWGLKYVGIQREDELKSLIRKNFFIRKTKEEVIEHLPARDWQEIELSEAYAVKNINDFNEETCRKEALVLEDMLARGVEIANASPIIRSLRQAQGLAIVPAVVDFVDDLLEQGIPLILFAHHRSVISKLGTGLAKHKPAIITGETSIQDRVGKIADFQTGRTDLIILNIMAGSVGVRLDRADYVVFGEIDFSPANMAQAVDRSWAMERKRGTTIFYFNCVNSIIVNIINILLTKVKAFEKVLK